MVTLLFPGPIIFFACFYEGQSNELLIRTPPKVSHCDDHTFLTHKNNGVTFVTNKYWDLQFILLFLVNQAGFYNSNNQFDICVTNPSEIGIIGQLSLLTMGYHPVGRFITTCPNSSPKLCRAAATSFSPSQQGKTLGNGGQTGRIEVGKTKRTTTTTMGYAACRWVDHFQWAISTTW